MRLRTLLDAVARDARFAVRSLLRARTLAVAAAVVLALGIGANAAIFAVLDALVVRPLPFRDPDTLAVVFETLAGRRNARVTVSAPAFEDLRRSGAFDAVEAVARTSGNLDRGDRADPVSIAYATEGLLQLLGVRLARGLPFGGRDERVAIVSERLFRETFGADPTLLGRTLTLDGVQRVVVGVLPASVSAVFPGDIWVPLQFTPAQLAPDRREYGVAVVLARVRPDSAAKLAGLGGRLRELHPDSGRGGFQLVPVRDAFVGELRPSLFLLMGAVALVLLVACANVANLLLARATARQKELAVRAALGAGRPVLARQLVIEGVLLALVGCVLGLLFALWAIELLAPLGSDAIRNARIEVDLAVLGFALLVAGIAGALAGLVPALQATHPDLAAQLKDGARRGMAGARRRVRDVLVVVEVALALVLLIAATHDWLAYRRLLSIDPGFEPRGAVAMDVSLPPLRFADPGAQLRFFSALLDRVTTLRGAETAGFAAFTPLSGSSQVWHFDVEGPGGRGSGHVVEQLQVFSPGTPRALGVAVTAGRGFVAEDGPSAPRVALVNEALARRYWPGESALGKKIRPWRFHFEDAAGRRFWALDQPAWCTVVGVLADVRDVKLGMEPRPGVILPLAQFPLPEGSVIVRGAQPAALRVALASVDNEIAAQAVQPLRDIVLASAEHQRDPMILLGLLAGLALLMAGMGLYGVMSSVVAERGRELSIRMALGADSVRILRLLVAQGLTLAALGVVCGLLAALVLQRELQGIATGLSHLELPVCALLAALLLAAAFLACWFPARRAARIDPRIAFRLD